MGREIRRVPLDFTHPLKQVWPGFLMPESLHGNPCPDCKSGYSEHAQMLHDLWYGYLPFDPASTGSTPLTAETPAVRAFAERNINSAPDFYGAGEYAIVREAQRLADHWNSGWGHHLSQDDVDVLAEAGRLHDFTHTWSRETGWQEKDPPVRPTAAQVNEWSISGFGHDGINAHIVVEARCEREGFPTRCATCQGHASIEAYPGQRAEAEAWEPTDPPEGDGWQLWETTSEGSPMSPVFATPEQLAGWMSAPERDKHNWVPFDTAMEFIKAGWAPSLMATQETGVVSGVEFVGFHADGGER
jgi:hypothetical protein